MKRLSVDEYADLILRGDDLKLSQDTIKELRACDKADLIRYHSSLGRAIRNSLGLWQIPWKPKIKDGVDISKDHPDALSMAILEAIHKKL